MKYDITHAIRNLYPNGAKYVQEGLEYSGLKWVDERPKPTKSEIDSEVKRLQAEYDNDYSRKREAEYPSVGDQLDMIYKDMKDSTTTHAEAVEAVKTKFPKE